MLFGKTPRARLPRRFSTREARFRAQRRRGGVWTRKRRNEFLFLFFSVATLLSLTLSFLSSLSCFFEFDSLFFQTNPPPRSGRRKLRAEKRRSRPRGYRFCHQRRRETKKETGRKGRFFSSFYVFFFSFSLSLFLSFFPVPSTPLSPLSLSPLSPSLSLHSNPQLWPMMTMP